MHILYEQGQHGQSVPFLELAKACARHGFGAINAKKEMVATPQAALEHGQILADHGLSWGLLPTPIDFYADDVDQPQFEEALQTLAIWAKNGEQAGIRRCYNHIWSGSNLRPYDENFEFIAGRVARVSRLLADHGILYGLEFIGSSQVQGWFKHPFVRTLAGVLALATASGEGCGFVFDTFHWYCSGGQMDDVYLAAQNIDKLANFHVNDARSGLSLDQQEDLQRLLPMQTGQIDSRAIYRLFEQAGYNGPLMPEPMKPWNENKEGRDLATTLAAVKASCDLVMH